MKLFIIVLLSISASAFKLKEHETEGSSQIVGGTLAEKGEFPYIINIQKERGGTFGHYCGGSIYNENWVITAAHCLSGPESYYKTVAGELDMTAESGNEQFRNIDKYIIHEDYNSATISNDIALIKLDQPLEFNQFIKSIPLNNDITTSGECTVAGWGSIFGDIKVYPNKLYKVILPLVSDEECRNVMGDMVTETNICSGDINGGGSDCNGDSGGPVIVKAGSDGDNYDVLTGLVSWGWSICGAPNKYNVYTQVSHFTDWIEKTVAANL